ncbi:hypothetical protein TeGR_g5416, partial [Tetraparma gracilis]
PPPPPRYSPAGATDSSPSVLFASVYDCDAGWPNPSADELRAADAYGFHAYALSNPDGYGTFGNNGISNDDIPLPCSDADSKEIPYARTIIDTIPSTSAIYTSGFSQNAMMAYYYHACFDRVSGTNQGGSGLALHGVDPTPPGGQVECTFSSAEQHGVPACKVEEPCDECMYWPAKPVGPLKTCLQTYTNDFLFGTDLNMFQTASVPGNDVRRLVFSPSAGVAGGHGWSQDNYDWMVSCLDIVPDCSDTCEADIASCLASADPGGVRQCLEDTASCADADGLLCALSKESLSSAEAAEISVYGTPWVSSDDPVDPTPDEDEDEAEDEAEDGPVEATEIAWTAGFSDASARLATALVGADVIFTWSGGHNVYSMAGAAEYESCSFAGGVDLGGSSPVTWAVPDDAVAGDVYYFGCEVGSHCGAGQKVAITIVDGADGEDGDEDEEDPVDPSPDDEEDEQPDETEDVVGDDEGSAASSRVAIAALSAATLSLLSIA